MTTINDGGPAFPIPNDPNPGAYEAHPGMSLRDWFAGQALCSIPMRSWDASGRTDAQIIHMWAQAAYVVADAMLAERTKVRS